MALKKLAPVLSLACVLGMAVAAHARVDLNNPTGILPPGTSVSYTHSFPGDGSFSLYTGKGGAGVTVRVQDSTGTVVEYGMTATWIDRSGSGLPSPLHWGKGNYTITLRNPTTQVIEFHGIFVGQQH